MTSAKRAMRAMRKMLTVALAPIWATCFVVALAAYFVYALAMLVADMAAPPRFLREWAEFIFG